MAESTRPQDQRTLPRQRDEADKQIAERLAAEPEPPTPTQEEADQLKEQAHNIDSGVPKPAEQPQPPPAGETAEQRRERERREREQQRDVKPGTNPTSYTTR